MGGCGRHSVKKLSKVVIGSGRPLPSSPLRKGVFVQGCGGGGWGVAMQFEDGSDLIHGPFHDKYFAILGLERSSSTGRDSLLQRVATTKAYGYEVCSCCMGMK